MAVLHDYQAFGGRHWETGTLHNVMAYGGIQAPHTGEPPSEALLLGVSGGITVGYFTFAYEGYDPQVNILTRNTFDPFDTICQRLGIVQDVRQTASPEKGTANLLESLAGGVPAIVWADMFTLPYNALDEDENMWQMMPVVVFGYDQEQDQVRIADRAGVPLAVDTGTFDSARSRVKNHKHRLVNIDPPDFGKLATAVQQGIWDCVRLYTEGPPRGSKANFGLAGLQKWAKMMTNERQKHSWANDFPPGVAMYAGLMSAFSHIQHFGKDGRAERDVYAAFLDEAASILKRPPLSEVAELFRTCGQAWHDLAVALLPDAVPAFKETRDLMSTWHRLFLERGAAELDEIHRIKGRLAVLREVMQADFPLAPAEATQMRASLADRVLRIHDLEAKAIEALQAAMH
ncbi:MAG: BtrH N-terminal domain-containing protein [Chloroflexi bacterium]|nr:BtrH N-terminal domain-containing protein [Chloroflexota bacterium]